MGTIKASGGRVGGRAGLPSSWAGKQASGSTKALNWQAGPPKASTVHGGTTGVIFCLDESVWSMELRGDGITGLGVAA